MHRVWAIGGVTLAVAVAAAGCGGGEVIDKLVSDGAASALEHEASEVGSRSLEGAAGSGEAPARLERAVDGADVNAVPAADQVERVAATGATAAAAERIRDCTGGALEATAKAYVQAYAEGDTQPDLSSVLDSSLTGCLSEAYPDQAQVIDAVSKVIQARIDAAAQQEVAAGATPQEYVDWLSGVASSLQQS